MCSLFPKAIYWRFFISSNEVCNTATLLTPFSVNITVDFIINSHSTDRSKAVVTVIDLLFVALRFILRGDLFYVLPGVILFLCFSILWALRLPRLGKRELIIALFVRLFDLRLFCLFPLLLGVWKGLRFVIVALPGLFSYLFHYQFGQYINICLF